MPRKRNLIPTTNLDCNVPTPIIKAVQDRLYDPRLGKVAYGAVGVLVTQLLSEWLAKHPLNPVVAKIKEEESKDAAASL